MTMDLRKANYFFFIALLLVFLSIIVNAACNSANQVEVTKKEFFPNGNLALLAEYDRQNDMEIVRNYYVDGSLKSIHYLKGGKINGTAVQFYENGIPKDSSFYSDGTLDGEVKTYYPDGSLKTVFDFIDGKLHGEAFVFSQNGELSSYRRYVKDSLHYEQKFDSSGDLEYTFTLPIVETDTKNHKVGDSITFFIYHPAPDTNANYFAEIGVNAPESEDKPQPEKIPKESKRGIFRYSYNPKRAGTYQLYGNIGFFDEDGVKNIYPFEHAFQVEKPADD